MQWHILATVGAKSIWVRQADEGLWLRAERFAAARRMSVSALLATALEEYLDRQQGKRKRVKDDDTPD